MDLIFEGGSDDTFGYQQDDYDNCGNGEPIEYLLEATSPLGASQRMLVVGQHAPGMAGGWLIGVAPVNDPKGDDVPIPAWPMRIELGEREYSPRLVIGAPENVAVTCLTRDGAEEC